jgi:hypothetical protein
MKGQGQDVPVPVLLHCNLLGFKLQRHMFSADVQGKQSQRSDR